jgi:demethylmenaquinone methyltransferase / 2-methoxy-6-polyprenyl-1,4-benzoquinol methylase
MFDRIARRYDRMNRLMSFGVDRLWRRRLVRALGELSAGDRVLDVASGTADVALAIARTWSGVEVVGLDPSEGMLEVGRRKVAAADLAPRVSLVVGDARALPFPDDHFGAACIAFGIRNVPDRLQGLREMARVTRPGGRVVVLELSEPRGTPLAALARLHVHHVVPRLGAWLAGEQEYRYLQESIAAFPAPPAFAEELREAGLEVVAQRPQTMRTAWLHISEVRTSFADGAAAM